VGGGYTTPGGPLRTGVPNPFAELMALAEVVREERGWEPVSFEIRVRPSGAYAFVACESSTGRSDDGFQVVLDGGYRLPQPGEDQEPGTGAPAGDPETAVARFRAYLERRAEILGRPEKLAPPATAAAIDEAEHRLGRRLPADLRALYALSDGDGDGYLFDGNFWLPLENVAAEHTEWGAGERPWYGWDLEWDSVVYDTAPADTVRRCGGHPGWLRFATGEDGNFLAVDTAPARAGRPGQVIRTGRDYDSGPDYVADSVTSLLGHYLELLERGRYETQDGHLSLFEGDSGPDTDTDTDTDTELIIDGLPDDVPPTVQAIHLNDAAGPVDLSPLTAAPALRLLHLNRCATADLTPLAGLPVEGLRVTLDHGDLGPLAGHPHLAALDLATSAPVYLAPLRTAPRLRGLDLSRAEVTDVTVLAELPELRYLALTGRQWSALLEVGALPPRLTAARLADPGATLKDALAWAARLGHDRVDAVRISGTLAVRSEA
jgi:cell wall assembly regulator SMI1